MKLLGVFVHEDDREPMVNTLIENEVQFTTLPATSGLAREDVVTFILILEADRIDSVVELFEKHCHEKEVGAPGSLVEGLELEEFQKTSSNAPVMIKTGGATGFVLPVDRLIKINEPDESD